MELSIQVLQPGELYHVYNRGNRSGDIFFQPKNYRFFLERYQHYISDYCKTYAYALLPNHFHFLIRVNEMEHIIECAKKDFDKVNQNFLSIFHPKKENENIGRFSVLLDYSRFNKGTYSNYFSFGVYEEFVNQLIFWILKERFRRFFMSYSKAINKQEGTTGSLFQKGFKKKELNLKNRLYTVYCTFIETLFIMALQRITLV